MLFRIDDFVENCVNPITRREYDSSWIVLILTNSTEYEFFLGSNNGCAYTVKVSKVLCRQWKDSVGDFISFNEAHKKNIILVMSETDYLSATQHYQGRLYNDAGLRAYEPSILIHSTSLENWEKIQKDGMLKSWNKLNRENATHEARPIGAELGDPSDFSDYIMFGGGVSGEIVVNSRQSGKIIMDINAEYLSGARLYFDFQKIAEDGLLIRDGAHLKVKDTLPLDPYLIWAATWESIGLPMRLSTPKEFAEKADEAFDLYQRYR